MAAARLHVPDTFFNVAFEGTERFRVHALLLTRQSEPAVCFIGCDRKYIVVCPFLSFSVSQSSQDKPPAVRWPVF